MDQPKRSPDGLLHAVADRIAARYLLTPERAADLVLLSADLCNEEPRPDEKACLERVERVVEGWVADGSAQARPKTG